MFYWIEECTDIYSKTNNTNNITHKYIYKNIFYHHHAGLNFVAILLRINVQEICPFIGMEDLMLFHSTLIEAYQKGSLSSSHVFDFVL